MRVAYEICSLPFCCGGRFYLYQSFIWYPYRGRFKRYVVRCLLWWPSWIYLSMPYCLSRPILLYTNIENNLKNMESFILLSQPSWIYFIVCCVILLKPSHLISILRIIWKIFSLPFCFAGHLEFILVCCRSSSRCTPPFFCGGHLGFIP